MRKLFRVRCEVNMRAEEVREVIIESNKSGNAIRGAIRQLSDDGYFNVRPISCTEVQ